MTWHLFCAPFLGSPSWPSSVKVFNDKCNMTFTIQPTPFWLPRQNSAKTVHSKSTNSLPIVKYIKCFFSYHLTQSLFDILWLLHPRSIVYPWHYTYLVVLLPLWLLLSRYLLVLLLYLPPNCWRYSILDFRVLLI